MIRVDIRQVVKLAEDIGSISAERLAESNVRALNESGEEAYELSRRTILRGVNLTDQYVDSRMETVEATSKRPTFSVVAPGGKGFQTNLSHYGAMLEPKAVNWSNERIAALGFKFGKWPGWTYRRGDVARGFEEDEKADKASVAVVKGARKSAGKKFTLPGKNDREGNPLLFRREGSRVKPVLGPSVYQLFRTTIPLIVDRVGDDLEQAVRREAERELQKALR